MLCDYEFYKNKYFGNVIAEHDFPRLCERASDKLDMLTFGRLADGLPQDEKIAVKVQKAVCALAEKIADIESANATIRQSGGSVVSSVSSGSESISFKSDTSITEVEQDKICYAIARDYLSGTGLLYAGL